MSDDLRSDLRPGFQQFMRELFGEDDAWKTLLTPLRSIQCQHCHMPDRRHLWRGIHDANMVRSGVEIAVRADRARYRQGDLVRARVAISTPRVGHAFPTYVTPQVLVRALLVDAEGQVVAGSVEERVIARQVPLDLSRELYDTRLAPKASFTMKESWRVDRPGLRLRARGVVEPDHFYTRFFEASVRQAGRGTAQLRDALRQTRRSSFTIFSREVPL